MGNSVLSTLKTGHLRHFPTHCHTHKTIFRCVSTSRFHKITDGLTDRHLAQFEIPQQLLKEKLCMTMYDYV